MTSVCSPTVRTGRNFHFLLLLLLLFYKSEIMKKKKIEMIFGTNLLLGIILEALELHEFWYRRRRRRVMGIGESIHILSWILTSLRLCVALWCNPIKVVSGLCLYGGFFLCWEVDVTPVWPCVALHFLSKVFLTYLLLCNENLFNGMCICKSWWLWQIFLELTFLLVGTSSKISLWDPFSMQNI